MHQKKRHSSKRMQDCLYLSKAKTIFNHTALLRNTPEKTKERRKMEEIGKEMPIVCIK